MDSPASPIDVCSVGSCSCIFTATSISLADSCSVHLGRGPDRVPEFDFAANAPSHSRNNAPLRTAARCRPRGNPQLDLGSGLC